MNILAQSVTEKRIYSLHPVLIRDFNEALSFLRKTGSFSLTKPPLNK